MSVFDVEQFLDATTTEAATRRPPLPAGAEFIASIGEPKPRSGEKDGTAWAAFDFPIEIDLASYPEAAALVGTDKVNLKYGAMLDVTESGDLDWGTGKNNGLRKLREALDMNKPGEPFSIRAMQGRMVRVKIKHRLYEGEIFDEVGAVAKV